ncbi:MAG TPA: hypothetical protein DIC18_00320 [Clostridiales bacterium]|nr:hypothetical protein [Clostridiales bacterium]
MDRKIKLYLLLVIAERGKGDQINDRIARNAFGFVTLLGHGTAKKHWLNLLGIGNIEKDLVAVLLSDDEIANARAVLEEEFQIGKGGGVAFTLRVQSIADKRVLDFFLGETEV